MSGGDASLALAPTGVEQKVDVAAIIADGLTKHPTVDKDDPLLFKHRFEHHDAATNRLTYYQYEARRHAHVVILDDLNATFCTYEEDEDDSSLLWLTLDVSHYAPQLDEPHRRLDPHGTRGQLLGSRAPNSAELLREARRVSSARHAIQPPS